MPDSRSPDPATPVSPLRFGLRGPPRAWDALDHEPPAGRRLYFGRRPSSKRSLATRGLVAVALITIVTGLFVWHRDQLRDSLDGEVSVADAIYFSLITLTTVGYGDIVPVTQRARLFDALLVTPIRLVLWLIFIGTTYQLVVQRVIEGIRMRVRQAELTDHVVVCGFGHGGRSAVDELLGRGVDPERIVVIDADEAAVVEAAERGLVGLRGDATRERVLRDARLEAARTAIVCLGRDDTTVLAVLTIRAISPDLRVVAVVEEHENERLLYQGGASATVCPSTLSGIMLANALNSSRVTDFVNDLLTIKGEVWIQERVAAPQDLGRPASQLADGGIALQVFRGDRVIGFGEAGDLRIEAGDQLLVLAPRSGRPRGSG